MGDSVPSKSVSTPARSGAARNGARRASSDGAMVTARRYPRAVLRLPRRPAALLLVVLVTPTLSGCRDGTVRVSFRPEVGAEYTYRVRVAADIVTRIGDQPVRHTTDEDVFTARHKVLDAGAAGSRVEVRLEAEGQETRTFEVRLDRVGRLAEVQRIEGIPADVLGGLGLSEIFPAAAGELPDRPLAPGDRWTIDEDGTGRLTRLGVVDGRRRATVESDYTQPVARTTDDGERP